MSRAIVTAHKISFEGVELGSVRLSSGKTGAVPLVYINGGPGGTYLDEHHSIGALSDERDIILYDQAGSYHSPAKFDPSLMPMPRFVRELKAVLEHHHLSKAILLGHSFGACIAIDFALAHPDHVAGIILSSPLISTARWIADANRLLQDMPDKEKSIIEKQLRGEDVDQAEYDAAERVFYSRHLCRLDPWPQRLLDSFSKGNTEIYNKMWGRSEFTCTGTLKEYDRFDDLSKLSMPVLLTCGRYDEARPETISEAAGRIRGAQFHVFENSSHCPSYEEAEEYLDVVRGFARNTGAA